MLEAGMEPYDPYRNSVIVACDVFVVRYIDEGTTVHHTSSSGMIPTFREHANQFSESVIALLPSARCTL